IFFEKLASPLGLINEETKEQSVFYNPIKEIGNLVFSYVLDDGEATPSPEVETTHEII
ncbi:MAG TPA: colicin V production protein, partial [Muricauda sp.]|nr:colicin V production protein [Allomuricauda sp.]